jgi:hypothetical protein
MAITMAKTVRGKGIVITIPYIAKSRVALSHIRQKNSKIVYAENTHISDINPEDCNLIFLNRPCS